MRTSLSETIDSTIRKGLCTGCGTCSGLCPSSAIEMVIKKDIYVASINPKKCNNCGLCSKVCPGREVDFNRLNQEIFGKKSENILLGNYLKTYVGYASNTDIRYNAASGGLITQLLIFALEKGIINSAMVTKMEEGSLKPKPSIVRTKEEIIKAAQSKYCPVPANVALRGLFDSRCDENGNVAIVGLPCHIHGIRNAERYMPEMRKMVLFHLGLFCSHTITFKGTRFLLEKLKVKKEQINEISYRGRGWPGKLTLKFTNHRILEIPYPEYYDSGFGLFIPARCLLCYDFTNELADISFGDAWLPEFAHDINGRSIIIVRSKIGMNLLQKASSEGVVVISEISPEKIIESQKSLLFKKRGLKARMDFRRILRKENPSYHCPLMKPQPIDYIRSLWMYFWTYTSHQMTLQSLLKIYSARQRVFRKYGSGILWC
ncbi:MAG: Coenzyme F420 hydrogenase/dehydrogenase, beta subunit C-terminal domain [Candidatus Bathyarchaeia archaeon]